MKLGYVAVGNTVLITRKAEKASEASERGGGESRPPVTSWLYMLKLPQKRRMQFGVNS